MAATKLSLVLYSKNLASPTAVCLSDVCGVISAPIFLHSNPSKSRNSATLASPFLLAAIYRHEYASESKPGPHHKFCSVPIHSIRF